MWRVGDLLEGRSEARFGFGVVDLGGSHGLRHFSGGSSHCLEHLFGFQKPHGAGQLGVCRAVQGLGQGAADPPEATTVLLGSEIVGGPGQSTR